MIYCCMKHIDDAIDDFIEQFQEPPELYRCSNNKDFTSEPPVCLYCDEPATYLLKRFSDG